MHISFCKKNGDLGEMAGLERTIARQKESSYRAVYYFISCWEKHINEKEFSVKLKNIWQPLWLTILTCTLGACGSSLLIDTLKVSIKPTSLDVFNLKLPKKVSF